MKTILTPGVSYSIGKFILILNEDSNELKIIVSTNKDNLLIKPSSSNSIIIKASSQ